MIHPQGDSIRRATSIAATPFPGNIIPKGRFDPVSAKMNADAIFGHANLPGTENNLYSPRQ